MKQPIKINVATLDPVYLLTYLYHAWKQLDPRDRVDAIWYMHPSTMDLIHLHQRRGDWGVGPNLPLDIGQVATALKLFGARIELADAMQHGVVSLLAENDQDRALRRFEERGGVVQVVKYEEHPLPPTPDPTLKAVARKWLKKARKKFKPVGKF